MELVTNGDFLQGNLFGWQPFDLNVVPSREGGGRFTLTNSTGSILQLLTTEPLRSYKISFVFGHAGCADNGVFEVFWNRVSILRGDDLPNFHRTSFHGEVTSSGTMSELLFAFTTAGGWFTLDKVSVQPK